MNWSEIAWKQSEDIYHKIITMPFIKGLTDGSLPPEKFRFYIEQDSHYLESFARALSLIAARAPEMYVLDYIRFAEGAVVVEKALHAEYFKKFDVAERAGISPACHHYSSFLLSTAAIAQVETAMAAVLPCFWIYKKAGDYIYSHQQREGNRYQDWIDTYAGEEFSLLVQKAIQICDEAAMKCSGAQQEIMTQAFVTASRLEWLFWDSAWRLEGW